MARYALVHHEQFRARQRPITWKDRIREEWREASPLIASLAMLELYVVVVLVWQYWHS
jgi:hypothetical protein